MADKIDEPVQTILKVTKKPKKVRSMIAEMRRRLFLRGFPTQYSAMSGVSSPFRRFPRDDD
jgi:hypothetical protein